MKRNTLIAALTASLLFCVTNLSLAMEKAQDPAADESATARKAKTPSPKPNPKIEARKKEAAKIKLTDINGASAIAKQPNKDAADNAALYAPKKETKK
ncbi:MAG: hypothetical protein NTX56_13635 [Proteobacteria bacterium]|nr:hypothetical protein [Pseudomonadota bacterium]